MRVERETGGCTEERVAGCRRLPVDRLNRPSIDTNQGQRLDKKVWIADSHSEPLVRHKQGAINDDVRAVEWANALRVHGVESRCFSCASNHIAVRHFVEHEREIEREIWRNNDSPASPRHATCGVEEAGEFGHLNELVGRGFDLLAAGRSLLDKALDSLVGYVVVVLHRR